jgi:hypothetical protein
MNVANTLRPMCMRTTHNLKIISSHKQKSRASLFLQLDNQDLQCNSKRDMTSDPTFSLAAAAVVPVADSPL